MAQRERYTSFPLFILTSNHRSPRYLEQEHLEMAQQFRMEFMQIPVVTRVYTTACILTTVAVVRSFFINGVQHTHLLCDFFPSSN